MNRKKALGKVAISLMILAVLLCIGEPDGKSIGDYVFDFIGIGAWSNGSSGLHYTALFAIALFLGGLIGAKIYYGSIKPRYILLVIVLLAVYPNIYSTAKGFVMAYSKGLNAVEYVIKDGNIKYEIRDGDRTVRLNATLNLINHGNKTAEFQVDFKPSEQVIRDTFKKNFDINVTGFKYHDQFGFTVSPHAHALMNVEYEAQIDGKDEINASGVIGRPGIIIKNEEQQIEFAGDND